MIYGKDFFERNAPFCDVIATVCFIACVTALFSIGGISFNRYVQVNLT